MDWYSFLSPEFAPPIETIRTRDRVPTTCTKCGYVSVVMVSNLKKQLAKLGTHLCWSCSARQAALRAKPKYTKTMLERYGVENPNQVPEVQERIKSTNKERYGEQGSQGLARAAFKTKYGVENPFELEEVKAKIKETNLKKYGVESLLSLKSTREKSFNTEEHTNISQIPETKEKVKNTMYEKYGGFHLENPDILEKSLETIRVRAEARKASVLPLILEELKANPQSVSSDALCKKFKVSYTTIIQWLRASELPQYIKDSTIEETLKVASLAEGGQMIANYIESQKVPALGGMVSKHFSLSGPSLRKALQASGNEHLIGRYKSEKETELYNFIKSIVGEHKILKNDRRALRGKELDIYLPDLNIAFEFNGLYWHDEHHLEKTYHVEKRLLCEAEGITLFQILEDEWDFKREIVKSIIRAKLNLVSERVFARKTIIKKVDPKEASAFLRDNHLMGDFMSAKHQGLYYNEELVSLLSYKGYKGGLDISRFCNKLNTVVVGGLSKLLKAVSVSESPKFIQSYIDLRYGRGESLKSLGFEKVQETLGWKWTDWDKTFNRLSCRANMDARKLSERAHAEELGWVKIYDSGQAKWRRG